MARPKNPRRVAAGPVATYYKPRGIPMSALEEVGLDLDEFEAIRLADLSGMRGRRPGTRALHLTITRRAGYPWAFPHP